MSSTPIDERLLRLVELQTLARQIVGQQDVMRQIITSSLHLIKGDEDEAVRSLSSAIDALSEVGVETGRLLDSIGQRCDALIAEAKSLPNAS